METTQSLRLVSRECEKYLPFFLPLEVYDLVFHSQQGIYDKNLRQVLGSAYHIEHAKTLSRAELNEWSKLRYLEV